MNPTKKGNKQANKNIIYNYVKYQVNDYHCEQQIINSASYCPCECCDGFLPIISIEYIPTHLLCYVTRKNANEAHSPFFSTEKKE